MKFQRSRTWYATIACVVFVICTYVGDLMRLTGLRRFFHGWVFVGVFNILQIAFCIGGIALAHAARLRDALAELGLLGRFGRAAAFSFIAAFPMLLVFALTSPINSKMSFLSVGVGCFLAPFAEEVLFRGYMFGQLYRRARWGFWLSALIPSALFAFGHAYQAGGPFELAGIFAVTGLGSLLGCWLYLRWSGNLWIVFGLHCLMNLWWEVFGVAETALGGWIANAARLFTVALAILLTVYKDRIWKPAAGESDWLAEDDCSSSDRSAYRQCVDAEMVLVIPQRAL